MSIEGRDEDILLRTRVDAARGGIASTALFDRHGPRHLDQGYRATHRGTRETSESESFFSELETVGRRTAHEG